MADAFMVEIDDINGPYWAGLREGVLKYQACDCGHGWLPPRKLCPSCLGSSWRWEMASGEGAIRSWVIYHTAYHPDFKERLPYNVAIVRLAEGPQLIANIAAPNSALRVGAGVRLQPDMTREQPIALFALHL
jgi:uncharacterized OB-fold protein